MSKILIIEDELSIAELERDYLELNDFEVEIETNGLKGLDKALNEEYSLILLDLMLPVLIIMLPAVYMWLCNLILEKIFRKYMSDESLLEE